jgi:hypothetical protein
MGGAHAIHRRLKNEYSMLIGKSEMKIPLETGKLRKICFYIVVQEYTAAIFY